MTSSIRYNAYFYANVCHICKKYRSDFPQCAGCRMIVYCNREHQKQHWPEHKDLCRAIQHVRETFAAELSACQGTPNMMKLLKEKVIHKLERSLELYEMQMFKYPRMCLVCYTRNDKLQECPHCMVVWFCAQHKDNHHDKSSCDHLKLCFESDLLFFHYLSRSLLISSAFMRVTSYGQEFSDMREFISIYSNIKENQSEISPEVLAMGLSNYLTRPLTVHYGMRILDYISTYEKHKKTLVIHVIAAYKRELATMREWEILLHIFPNLQSLKLVLIGPLLKCELDRRVCNNCVQKKKTRSVEIVTDTYAQYTRRHLSFREPDLVIMFCNNSYCAELRDMWKSSVKYVAKRNCPFLVCYSRENMSIDKIINTELGKTIEFRKYTNPFASLKPDREYDDDFEYPVFYENKYLNVYKTLCP